NVQRQAGRGGNEKLLGGELTVGFDGDARILGRRPYAHRQNGGAPRNLLCAQQQHQAASLQQRAARRGGRQGGVQRAGVGCHAFIPCSRLRPRGVWASSVTFLSVSSVASMYIARSASGVSAAAFS